MAENGSDLLVETRGEGSSTILLLHGGGVAGWMWEPLASRIESSYRLVIPDLPGHDRSQGAAYRSHDATIEILATVIEKDASTPVTVVGFSLGAQLAVLLAARYPRLVQDVVIISAQAKPTPCPGATLALLRMAAPLARNEKFARLQAKELFVPNELMDDYLRTSRSINAHTLVAAVGENLKFTVPPGWSAFPGRSLVMVGERERVLMRKSAQLLAEAHSRSEIVVVESCGHGIPFQQPERLAVRLQEWLRGAG
ncbi:alpha/beta fold hydrolase [Gulosibacter chungangensis]|nr:alpha/beta hydrolase [Gulosibacter chungangensis]